MKQIWVKVKPWDKALAIAAIESGADAVIVEPGISPRVRELGRITTVAEDGDRILGRDVIRLDIQFLHLASHPLREASYIMLQHLRNRAAHHPIPILRYPDNVIRAIVDCMR